MFFIRLATFSFCYFCFHVLFTSNLIGHDFIMSFSLQLSVDTPERKCILFRLSFVNLEITECVAIIDVLGIKLMIRAKIHIAH